MGNGTARVMCGGRAPGEIILESIDDTVSIIDKNTRGSQIYLQDYPIKWSALDSRPFKEYLDLNNYNSTHSEKSSIQNAVFGVYAVANSSIGMYYYPAFAYVGSVTGGFLP